MNRNKEDIKIKKNRNSLKSTSERMVSSRVFSTAAIIRVLCVVAIFLNMFVSNVNAQTDQKTCIPLAYGVPALPGAPNWWNTTLQYPNYYNKTDDPRWVGAVSHTYGGNQSEDVTFRALYDSQNNLYLSWRIDVDPSFDPNQDLLYVGISPGGSSQDVIVKVTPYFFNAPLVAAKPYKIRVLIRNTTTGGWEAQSTIPKWLLDSNYNYTAVWFENVSSHYNWAVQMKVPKNSSIDSGINFGTNFRMWYEVQVMTPGGSTAYDWPRTTPTFQTYPDISTWGNFSLGTGGPGCGEGVSISWNGIGTNNTPSSQIKLNETNTFYARPFNNMSKTINSSSIYARFRIANWGSRPDWNNVSDPSQLWSDIRGGSKVPNTLPISPGTSGNIQFDWTLNDTEKAPFLSVPPEKRLHQCMLVELSGPNLTFITNSVYKNMDFVHASNFSRDAEISVIGLPPLIAGKRDVYLYVQTKNMPSYIKPEPLPSFRTIWEEQSRYLFSLDATLERDKQILLDFLIQNYGISWVRAANIEVTDNGKTARVYTENRYLWLRFNDDRTKVKLEIDDGRTDEFIVKMDIGKLNIYRSSSPLPFTWNSSNFEGFNVSGVSTETLRINQTDLGSTTGKTRTLRLGELTYNSTKKLVEYEVTKNTGLNVSGALDSSGRYGDGGYYARINLFGESYVGMYGSTNELAKIILEQTASDKKILSVGETWNIGDGWTLTAKSIYANKTSRKAELVLRKDDVELSKFIVDEGNMISYMGWQYDSPIFVTYIDSVFTGQSSNMVQLKYTWAASDNTLILPGEMVDIRERRTSVAERRYTDEIGVFRFEPVMGDSIYAENYKEINLTPNKIIPLANILKFKVINDKNYLRFYPILKESETLEEMPAERVFAYYDSGRNTTIEGVNYTVLDRLDSFGYYVQTDEDLAGWKTALKGAQLMAPDFYKIGVPNNGSVVINTTIETIEPEAIEPGPGPTPPPWWPFPWWPVPWWFWLLLLIILLVVILLLRRH